MRLPHLRDTSAVLLAVATALPWWRTGKWWVRLWEFPRLQLAAWAAATAAGELLPLAGRRPVAWPRAAAAAAVMAYHASWILPYSRLWRADVPRARRHDGPRVSVFAANVLQENRNVDLLLRQIRQLDPTIVVTVESDAWWERRLDSLRADYPHTVKCAQDNTYGMHVYSKVALEDPRVEYLVEPDVPSVHATAVVGHLAVHVHFVHPRPPAPQETGDSTARDLELIIVGRHVREVGGAAIVAGDLNDVGWSQTTRDFLSTSGLRDPRIGRGMYNSFHAQIPVMRWPLDHLFHSHHFTLVQMKGLKRFGSDHFPIFVELAVRSRA